MPRHNLQSAAAIAIDRDAALANLVEQMADELRNRGAVDIAAWQQRYPEHASEIDRLAPTLGLLVDVGQASRLPGQESGPELDGQAGRLPHVLGDFRIVRELGRGGMGIVYEAEQLSLNRRVALKILPTAAVLDPRTLQRFKNEAQAAAALDHPHIVDVYGVGCERGVHYYAMRLIDGCTLAEVIEELRDQESGVERQESAIREGEAPAEPPAHNPKSKIQNQKSASTAPLALLSTVRSGSRADFYRKIAALGIHVAEALAHAHEQGVVHRDIKPSNLLLDGHGKVWITDFGLAQIETGQSLTQTGDLLGTLRYMSPEQTLAGRTVIDQRSDIYSLGATLYELLTLERVFGEGERASLLRQIALADPTPPRRLNPQIPGDLETIVLKMLEKDPRNRYSSAADLAADLTRFVENKPIAARRPRLTQRVGKWAARNRTLVTTAAVLLLACGTLVGALAGWWSRDTAARKSIAERVANEAWLSADRFCQRRDWSAALAELKRAESVLAASSPSSDLAAAIASAKKDASLALQLEEIRLLAAALSGSDFDFAAVDVAYDTAFAAYGVRVFALSPEEAVARIRLSKLRDELGMALTNWSIARMRSDGQKTADSRLLALARSADPDPWRNRLRQPWKRGDLIEMAALPELEKQSAATLFLFVTAAMYAGATDDDMQTKVRQLQRRCAGDFWLNFAAARYFENTQPPQWDEAVRYYSVAVGLRPDAGAVHSNLGAALHRSGRIPEAIAEYRLAIEHSPQALFAHANLGAALADDGQYDEAVAAWRTAIQLGASPTLIRQMTDGHRSSSEIVASLIGEL